MTDVRVHFHAIAKMTMRSCHPIPLLMLVVGLSSCASLSPDGHEPQLRKAAQQRLGLTDPAPEDIKAGRDAWLDQTLDMSSVATVAMINNPGLQRRFADLRITEAEIVAATRWPNPRLSVARLAQGGGIETDRGIGFDLIGLLTLPVRGPLGKQHYEAARQEMLQSLLELAYQARLALVDAVASRQRLAYAVKVVDAAEAGRDLARQLAQAGNLSRLDAAREQAFHAQAAAEQVRAQTAARAALERLTRLLGVEDARRLKLPERLPELPGAARELADVEQQALNQRIDVQLARQASANTARSLRLTKVTRLINVLDLTYKSNTLSDHERQTGVEVSLEVPLFDFGGTRVAEAEAIYRRSLADIAETAVQARSEAREAYTAYRSAYDLARHYRDEVVPLQQTIADETLLRYNGMLISTFDLLAQSREQVAASEAAVSALRDFWAADVLLDSRLHGAMSPVQSESPFP